MPLDLKLLKQTNDRVAPYLKALTDLVALTEAAVESGKIVEQAERDLKIHRQSRDAVLTQLTQAREDLTKAQQQAEANRKSHQASINALATERQQQLDSMKQDVRLLREQLDRELAEARETHAAYLRRLATEKAEAEDALSAVKKSLAEMTSKVRASLGL